MRYRVFLDTNVLISGIFFEGNESKILELPEIDLITCDYVIDELKIIIKKKLKYLGNRSLEIALSEMERALSDIEVIGKTKYSAKIKIAEKLITHTKDIPVLAAVLFVRPDYFLTGDAHFFNEKIKGIVNVKTTSDLLSEISLAD